MSEWISVKDRLPHPKIFVLGLSLGAERIYICSLPDEDEYNEHWHVCRDQDCICTQPTAPIDFWMPLPNLPEEL